MSSSCARTETGTSTPSRSCTAATSRQSSGSCGASSVMRCWQFARTLKMSECAVEPLLYRAGLAFNEEYLASQREGELTHEEALPLRAPYLAGKLRRPQPEAVRAHIASCAKCPRRIGPR